MARVCFLSSHRVPRTPKSHTTMGLQMPRTTPLGMSWESVSWFLAVQVKKGCLKELWDRQRGIFGYLFLGQSCILQLGLHFFHHPESQNPSLNSKVKLHHLRMRTKYKSCWGSDKSWNPLCTFSNLKHWVAFHEAFKNRMGNTRTGSDCEGKPYGLLKL